MVKRLKNAFVPLSHNIAMSMRSEDFEMKCDFLKISYHQAEPNRLRKKRLLLKPDCTAIIAGKPAVWFPSKTGS